MLMFYYVLHIICIVSLYIQFNNGSHYVRICCLWSLCPNCRKLQENTHCTVSLCRGLVRFPNNRKRLRHALCIKQKCMDAKRFHADQAMQSTSTCIKCLEIQNLSVRKRKTYSSGNAISSQFLFLLKTFFFSCCCTVFQLLRFVGRGLKTVFFFCVCYSS